MKTSEFDKKFDKGENVMSHLDKKSALRPSLKQRRVNVDFPDWMVSMLDQHAQHLGVTRQALIKFWMADKLQQPLDNR
ncbi:MAG: CopG family transcriptional regulator [Alphaproteobacteria bacterium]|nr:CopG family transcriptional regulator [Alphaproteobacteria bacterium]